MRAKAANCSSALKPSEPTKLPSSIAAIASFCKLMHCLLVPDVIATLPHSIHGIGLTQNAMFVKGVKRTQSVQQESSLHFIVKLD